MFKKKAFFRTPKVNLPKKLDSPCFTQEIAGKMEKKWLVVLFRGPNNWPNNLFEKLEKPFFQKTDQVKA